LLSDILSKNYKAVNRKAGDKQKQLMAEKSVTWHAKQRKRSFTLIATYKLKVQHKITGSSMPN